MRSACRNESVVQMAKKTTVIKEAKKYAKLIACYYSVKEVVLFGSYARGTQKPESDIDIAVVFKKTPDNVLSTEAELYRLGMEINSRIEPVLIDEKNDLGGFWKNISSYGKVIYKAA